MTLMPDKADLDGSSNPHNQGILKLALGKLRDFVADCFGGDSGQLRTVHDTFKLNGPATLNNIQIVPSVAANALTIALKNGAGADASAAAPALVGVRHATLGNGSNLLRHVAGAASLVVSSGSTLGHRNNVPTWLYVYLIDNAGALEPAVSSSYFGPQGVISTTAEGGGGNADSFVTMYSAAARANVGFRCIGRMLSSQAVAGTWTANPTRVELWPFAEKSAVEVRTGNTMLGAQNDKGVIFATGTWTQTFDTCANLGPGWTHYFRNDGVGNITLDPSGAETVNGQATLVLVPGQACMIVCDGSTLKTIGLTVAQVGAATLAASALGSFVGMVNGKIVQSRAGNAETIAIKTEAGADPSAADPVGFVFRSSTAGDGSYVTRWVTGALSLVISSGSTLACVNNEPFRLWLLAFDDAGTVVLGVVKATTGSDAAGWNTMDLAAWGIASSTAEGGAGGADAAQVIYTAAAVTNKPYSLIGYATWEAGLAAVGTWNTAPTRIQLFGPGVPLPGAVVKRVRERETAVATGSTNTVSDDTPPTNAEGDEFQDAAIAPSSAANVILAEWFLACMSSNGAAPVIDAALFNGAANLGSVETRHAGANLPLSYTLQAQFLAGTTSAITVDGRAGTSQAGAVYTFNGVNAARRHGGSLATHLQLQEVMA